ncbi:MAG: hypothetical protein JWP69_1866 [Flaviaesturariibacter sp.]|nr:hypothetical protein [Flaviaesturariibacter sp.]
MSLLWLTTINIQTKLARFQNKTLASLAACRLLIIAHRAYKSYRSCLQLATSSMNCRLTTERTSDKQREGQRFG